MRFYPSDPDISTIFNRIKDGDINLQPDFQRGEVWSEAKQQRLIDSILRGWIVPPVLVVPSKGGNVLEVLDGQQRLASIRDFKLNRIKVDGLIKPYDSFINGLHGKTYESLPIEAKKLFDKASIRMFEVTNFLPDEPAEIFFRLNQPTSLTSAEKRNAFFGPVRSQLKDLIFNFAPQIEKTGLFAFSNSRMAYDEVFARLVCTLEQKTLNKKITANAIDEMYRRVEPIDIEVISRVERSFELLLEITRIVADTSSVRIRLNKATAHSWLLFMARLDSTGDLPAIARYMGHFESVRQMLANPHLFSADSSSAYATQEISSHFEDIFRIFNDRAASRVADVSSVLLRDLSLWLSWIWFSSGNSAGCFDNAYQKLRANYKDSFSNAESSWEVTLIDFASWNKWGEKV